MTNGQLVFITSVVGLGVAARTGLLPHYHGAGAGFGHTLDGADVREGSEGVYVSKEHNNKWKLFRNTHLGTIDPQHPKDVVILSNDENEHPVAEIRNARSVYFMDRGEVPSGRGPGPNPGQGSTGPSFSGIPDYQPISYTPTPPRTKPVPNPVQDLDPLTQTQPDQLQPGTQTGTAATGVTRTQDSSVQTGDQLPSQSAAAATVSSTADMDRTIDALNVSRHQSKLHFRTDRDGKITAGAHDLSQADADKLLASSHGKLIYHADTKRVELTAAMTESELTAFHRDARALGKAVHGDEDGFQREYGSERGGDGISSNRLENAIAGKNALNQASGQSHLHFELGADNMLRADAGKMGQYFGNAENEAFVYRALGDPDKKIFSYDEKTNSIVANPDVLPAKAIAAFQENARAIGRLHMGHIDGAKSELVKIHGGIADSPAAPSETQTVEDKAPPLTTAPPTTAAAAAAEPVSQPVPIAAPEVKDKPNYLDLSKLDFKAKTEIEQVMLLALHDIDKKTYPNTLGPEGVDGKFGKPLPNGGHAGYTGHAVEAYKHKADLGNTSDTSGSFDSRLIQTFQAREKLPDTKGNIDQPTLDRINQEIDKFKKQHIHVTPGLVPTEITEANGVALTPKNPVEKTNQPAK